MGTYRGRMGDGSVAVKGGWLSADAWVRRQLAKSRSHRQRVQALLAGDRRAIAGDDPLAPLEALHAAVSKMVAAWDGTPRITATGGIKHATGAQLFPEAADELVELAADIDSLRTALARQRERPAPAAKRDTAAARVEQQRFAALEAKVGRRLDSDRLRAAKAQEERRRKWHADAWRDARERHC